MVLQADRKQEEQLSGLDLKPAGIHSAGSFINLLTSGASSCFLSAELRRRGEIPHLNAAAPLSREADPAAERFFSGEESTQPQQQKFLKNDISDIFASFTTNKYFQVS